MIKKPKIIKKIEPSSKVYEQRANNIARGYVSIHPCKDCGNPVIEPYCCTFCGSIDP